MERCEQMRGWLKAATANAADEVASASARDAGDTG